MRSIYVQPSLPKWFSVPLAIQSTFALAVIFQLKGFVLPYQVIRMYELWENPIIDGFRYQNPHTLRYLVMYPVFVAEQFTGLDRHYIYSYFALAAYLSTIYLNDVLVEEKFHGSTRLHFYKVLVCVFYTCLFALMSGRLPIAFCGYSFVVAAILLSAKADRWYLRTIGLSVVGVLLCTVSSGTFFSAILCLIGALTISVLLFGHMQRSVRLLMATLVVLAVFNIQIPVIFMASFSYFGNGISALRGMFSHGYGAIILDNLVLSILIGIILASGVLASLLTIKVKLSERTLNIALITIIAICLGAFGYSSLLMALVPGLFLVLMILESGIKSMVPQ